MTHRQRLQKGLRKAIELQGKKCPAVSPPSKRDVKEQRVRKPLIEAFWPVNHRPKKKKNPMVDLFR